jgi:hypothetical protein
MEQNVPSCTAITGTDNLLKVRMLVLRSALSLYAKTGFKANRLYTPLQMLSQASAFTGKPYKKGDYAKAAKDIKEKLDANR